MLYMVGRTSASHWDSADALHARLPFQNDSDNDRSFSQPSVHKAQNCPEGQDAWRPWSNVHMNAKTTGYGWMCGGLKCLDEKSVCIGIVNIHNGIEATSRGFLRDPYCGWPTARNRNICVSQHQRSVNIAHFNKALIPRGVAGTFSLLETKLAMAPHWRTWWTNNARASLGSLTRLQWRTHVCLAHNTM